MSMQTVTVNINEDERCGCCWEYLDNWRDIRINRGVFVNTDNHDKWLAGEQSKGCPSAVVVCGRCGQETPASVEVQP